MSNVIENFAGQITFPIHENWKSKVLQWPFDFWTLCNSKFIILDFFWRNAIDRVSQIAFWVVVTSDIRYKVQLNGRQLLYIFRQNISVNLDNNH